jgi:glutathione S-transferase kappa 1
VPNVKTPDFFPILSLLPHAQKFVQAFLDIYHGMWEEGLDVSKPELLGQVLLKSFSESEAKGILSNANSAPYKQRLNDNTKDALESGAFGCPWFVVRNSKGEVEPFFGSDRYVWTHFPGNFYDYQAPSCRGPAEAFGVSEDPRHGE